MKKAWRKPASNGRHKGRIGVAKGYGPLHAENALEGEEIPKLQGGTEAVPSELPTPPDVPETRGGRFFDWLANEVRQGVLSDEDIVEIKRNPYGPAALAAYANAGIMLSRGAGGKGAGELPRGAVPEKVWTSWKLVQKPEVGIGKSGEPESVRNAIRVDPAGNHYEYMGSHITQESLGSKQEYHAIVQPVEPPSERGMLRGKKGPVKATERLGPSPEEIQAKFQEQFGKKPPEEPPQPLSEEDLYNLLNPPGEEPPLNPNVPRYRKGKAKVGVAKGFGPRHAENAKEGATMPNTDTVPALLTPREAVLNRNAAELAGRGNIEKLNKKGNKLAAQGVDLAAEGDDDVTDASIRAQKGESEQHDREIADYFDLLRKMEGRNMREGAAALRTKPGRQFNPEAGSPAESSMFRQLFDRMGGTLPEEQLYPDFIKLRNQLSIDPIMAQQGTSNMKPKKYQQGTKDTDPYAGGPQPGYPQQAPGPAQPPSPFGTPQYPREGASFYPQPPQQQQQPVQAQGGLENVEQIGRPQGGYPWQMVPLTGGQLSALQKTMEKEGLNKDQIAGLTSAFKGFGSLGSGGQAAPGVGAYQAAGSPTMVYGASGYPSAIPVGGYQGGISDIGYPPFVAPNAVYHGDKSSWQGAYDPNYMIPGYAGGTYSVNPELGKFGEGRTNAFMTGGAADRAELFGPDRRMAMYSGQLYGGPFGGFGYQPPVGTPGFLQGSTMNPSAFNSQGYPIAQAVTPSFSDAPSLMSRHTPQRRPQ